MNRSQAEPLVSCPSSQPRDDGGVIFGVIVGEPGARQVGYLNKAIPATPEALAMAGKVRPTEVFRIAAPCATNSCKHFAGNTCSLAERIVRQLKPVVNGLAPCLIRKTCRWFHQEGKAACLRCPQVITDRRDASEMEMNLADPAR